MLAAYFCIKRNSFRKWISSI